MSKRKKKSITLPLVGFGRNIEVHIVEVADPYEPAKKLTVAKNVNTHPLDHLLSRELISADQKSAGDAFLKLYERAEIGGAQAIDYSRVKVDVSFQHRGLDPAASSAIDELEEIRGVVGKRAYGMLWEVIGRRRSTHDLACEIDGVFPQQRTKRFILDTLRCALDDLAEHFQVYARGRGRAA